jgi:hypothetical protein
MTYFFLLLIQRIFINFFRNCIFRKFFSLVSSLFILILFLYFNKEKYKNNFNKNTNMFLLQKTVLFPRGGDDLIFNQPWSLVENKIYKSINELFQKHNQSKYVTGDFYYRYVCLKFLFKQAKILLHLFN